jgi:biotin transport system substrate-specific component
VLVFGFTDGWGYVPSPQTLAVVLTAASLGPLRGTAVQVVYILVALMGLPFYADASGGVDVVFGATGGYVIGFIPAAFLIGPTAGHGADRRPHRAVPLFVAGQAVIFVVGVPWLAITAGMTASAALDAGFYPFVLGGILKAFVAALVLGTAWAVIGRRSGRSRN